MSYRIVGHSVFGRMPSGQELRFNSLSEYEDAYYDWLFEANNEYSVETPEDY